MIEMIEKERAQVGQSLREYADKVWRDAYAKGFEDGYDAGCMDMVDEEPGEDDYDDSSIEDQ